MAAGDIYRKTDKGAAQISDRRMKVGRRLPPTSSRASREADEMLR